MMQPVQRLFANICNAHYVEINAPWYFSHNFHRPLAIPRCSNVGRWKIRLQSMDDVETQGAQGRRLGPIGYDMI